MNAPPIEHQADLIRLRDDFAFFAKKCLKIVDKHGNLQPLILNKAQTYIHQRLEAQRKKGKVRAVIVKGRQLGCSTYIQARFYWRLWRTTKTLQAFILTHHDDATTNLFGMARRYHDNLPAPIRPKEERANEKQLIFADTKCGYHVATAGGKEVGRSQTIQLFHGSEVPSWTNAPLHVSSVLRTALTSGPESEGILEATAKGVGNVFHTYALDAMKGNSDYELIFVPFYWGEDCEEPCPANHPFSDKWLQYGQLHKLNWEHLYWAWKANFELARANGKSVDEPCSQFHEEYPATVELAFQSSGDSFIPAVSVYKARQPEKPIIGHGPIILGVDPSRDRDRCGVIDRCGRRLGERICEAWPPTGDTVYLAQKLAGVIKKLRPDAVNIDVGGVGAGVYDNLVNMGYGDICNPVNFGSAPVGLGPTGQRMYANRRAEMWDEMRDWFEQEGGVQVPDRDDLHADLTAPVWGPGATRERNNALVIEEKEKIKERLGASPDIGDAAALCFAVPFAGTMRSNNQPRQKRRTGKGGY